MIPKIGQTIMFEDHEKQMRLGIVDARYTVNRDYWWIRVETSASADIPLVLAHTSAIKEAT